MRCAAGTVRDVDPELDLAGLEREFCRIPEVTAARVVAGASGEIEEVHILSLPSKHAKQVVRDVQSVALATFDLDLDRRLVSVVQLDDGTYAAVNGGPGASGEPDAPHAASVVADRINVETVTATRAGVQCTAQVVLTRGDERGTGVTEGIVAMSSVQRLVAQATIAALRELEPAAARADVESAAVVSVGGRSIALTTVVIVVPPYEEVCAGSAVVRAAGEFDAVARAVLDATNRRLPQLR